MIYKNREQKVQNIIYVQSRKAGGVEIHSMTLYDALSKRYHFTLSLNQITRFVTLISVSRNGFLF